ncbi:MAG: MBOAT family protein, partial [Lachnospiraceae bacterium]|nr:MBOAT family protein [Lachnospiraceae bacterium]
VTLFSQRGEQSFAPAEKRVTVPVPLTHLGVILNIALLAFFKFAGLLDIARHGIVMPVALSFTTFTQIAFLLDMRSESDSAESVADSTRNIRAAYPDEGRRNCSAEPDRIAFSDYLLHVLFFPKVLQGPVQRFEETKALVLDRLHAGVHAEGLMEGVTLFTLGLAKKVLLADTLGKAVALGYAQVTDLTRPDALVVMLIYPLQLYLDFSGYCDMGRGVAKMLSLDLADNFDHPYRALSVSDYWSRWHKSLTRFFTRYVYIPLGGSKRGTARTCANIMIVFLLSGLWHGTGWGFLIWGAMQGAAIVVERILRKCVRGLRTPHQSAAPTAVSAPLRSAQNQGPPDLVRPQGEAKELATHLWLRRFATYLYIAVSLTFFRAPTVTGALQMLTQPFRALVNYVSPAIAETFYMDEIWYVVKALHLDGLRLAPYVCMAIVVVASFVVGVCAGGTKTPHQSAAPTAVSAPLRSAQNQGPPDLVRPQGEAKEVVAGSTESVADSPRNIRAAYPDEGKRNRSAEPVQILSMGRAALLGILFAWCVISLSEVQTFLYVNF